MPNKQTKNKKKDVYLALVFDIAGIFTYIFTSHNISPIKILSGKQINPLTKSDLSFELKF